MNEAFTFEVILYGDFEGLSIDEVRNNMSRAILAHLGSVTDIEIECIKTERT